MKWLIGTLIAAVLTAPLILENKMDMQEQQLGYEKRNLTLNYEGAINGKHFFKMALTREGDTLNGTLISTFNKNNEVLGLIDQDESFVLTEYEGGKKVGVLEGKFIPGGELKGTWSTPDGKKWFPFYLIKKTN
jgi:hypothetical protein